MYNVCICVSVSNIVENVTLFTINIQLDITYVYGSKFPICIWSSTNTQHSGGVLDNFISSKMVFDQFANFPLFNLIK